jgi:hypothetical protein
MIFFSFFKTLCGKEVWFQRGSHPGWASSISTAICFTHHMLPCNVKVAQRRCKLRVMQPRFSDPMLLQYRRGNSCAHAVQVTVELKNDLSITGTLHSVDQYMNIKLDNVKVVNEDKFPHMVRSLRTLPTAQLFPSQKPK